MHLKDIFECSCEHYPADHLYISNKIRCTNLFLDIKEKDYEPLDHPTPPVIECGIYNKSKLFRIDICSYYDDKDIYESEIERYVVLSQNRQRAFILARHLKSWIIENFDLVFVFLQEPTAIFLAEALIEDGVNVISIVMDPPEMRHFFYQNKKLTRELIDTSFKHVSKRSVGVVLPSESAVNSFTHKPISGNSIAAYPIFRSYTAYNHSSQSSINSGLLDEKRLRIVLVGQIYAPESLNAFLVALAIVKENDVLDTIDFVYYGGIDGRNKLNKLKDNPKLNKINIQINDTLDYSKLVDLISRNFDFGYTPFPFSNELSGTISYSFPSKFVSYLEAGITPLYHGPRSTVSDILGRYQLNDFSIESIDSKFISKRIISIINHLKKIEDNARISMLSRLFTREILTKNIDKLIAETMAAQ